MDATTPLNPEAQRKQDRARKRKAILAGGVVLGLGAAVTLAAWSDDVFANGTFNTGSFELQGSLDNTDFLDYDNDGNPADGPATLSFQLDADSMAPSQTVYAPFTIATSTTTSLDGTFTLASVSVDGSYDGVLTYQIFTEATHGANCSPSGAQNLAPAARWAGGVDTLADGVVGGTALPVLKNQGTASPSAGRQHLCFAVTMGEFGGAAATNQANVEAATQASPVDNSTVVTWTFNGQSTDA
ncbi:SipW-dependent-type signal peptide-containing protein [Dietzia maris]